MSDRKEKPEIDSADEFPDAVTFDRFHNSVIELRAFLEQRGLSMDLPVVFYNEKSDEVIQVDGMEFNDDTGQIMMITAVEDNED